MERNPSLLASLLFPSFPLALTGVNRPLCFYNLIKVMARPFGFRRTKKHPWERRSKSHKDGWGVGAGLLLAYYFWGSRISEDDCLGPERVDNWLWWCLEPRLLLAEEMEQAGIFLSKTAGTTVSEGSTAPPRGREEQGQGGQPEQTPGSFLPREMVQGTFFRNCVSSWGPWAKQRRMESSGR